MTVCEVHAVKRRQAPTGKVENRKQINEIR